MAFDGVVIEGRSPVRAGVRPDTLVAQLELLGTTSGILGLPGSGVGDFEIPAGWFWTLDEINAKGAERGISDPTKSIHVLLDWMIQDTTFAPGSTQGVSIQILSTGGIKLTADAEDRSIRLTLNVPMGR